MNPTIYGIDIAKHVFQLHWVDPDTGEIQMLKLKRCEFLSYFSALLPCLIGMEACGGAHHWARRLEQMGHVEIPQAGNITEIHQYSFPNLQSLQSSKTPSKSE